MEEELTYQFIVEVDSEIIDIILSYGLLPPFVPLCILGISSVGGFDGFAIGRC